MEITYATHTAWSNPGSFRSRLNELPETPRALADVLENFMIHHAIAHLVDVNIPGHAEFDRNLRTVERLLGAAFLRDRRSLSVRRDLSSYLYVGSRDFALMAASVLRSRGMEARLRVGFADYLAKGRWEEHWLCEYRVGGSWKLFDAQLGQRVRKAYGINFAIDDVPRHRFLAASSMWLAIRSGKTKAAQCGRFREGISGAWLPAANILKDVATLCAIEPLASDCWGYAVDFSRNRAVSVKAYDELDAVAEAFGEPPQTPSQARLLVGKFPWAKPCGSVTNIVDDMVTVAPEPWQPALRRAAARARVNGAEARSV